MSPEAAIAGLVADRLAQRRAGDPPLVLGLCGAQGSGKSTVAARLAERFEGSAILSLDDLYRTRADRQRLAREVHPLFATRGVPGTHDVALGVATLAGIARGEAVPLPRFDKAIDDRALRATWPAAPAPCSLLIFEGWCVGARPQTEEALAAPINRLEAEEDAEGIWRRYVNAVLAADYPALFDRLDMLVLMMPPDWPTVLRWRTQQEEALRCARGEGAGVMNDAQLARFVSHYERLTRHIWAEMPWRADLCLRLDEHRALIG
ncbi:kinase [Sphingomonas sanguinis]|uniref:Kinase n=1 Tax=Sphingomonas sanguinis TaxID=33051 RepID=A0A7Y7QTP7_9SPHN|nr:kinase [Sphingomonas sanguinis]NNG50273.1 kinase [Sphingomonas sanguinis]NNG55174.1 kinase [Sphingomonas sanguinis]NVP30474.1 kinase [Sphingomonas sanguinis]